MMEEKKKGPSERGQRNQRWGNSFTVKGFITGLWKNSTGNQLHDDYHWNYAHHDYCQTCFHLLGIFHFNQSQGWFFWTQIHLEKLKLFFCFFLTRFEEQTPSKCFGFWKERRQMWMNQVKKKPSCICMYLHNNDFHTENFILCTSFVCDVGKLVDLWWIHLLKTVKANLIL